jgi:CRP/FNR family cyclic AMP-dependent transcriptional regulator
MFIETNHTESFDHIDSVCKQRAEALLQGLRPECGAFHYEVIDDLFKGPGNEQRVFLVEEGAVSFEQNGMQLFHYDSGDIIGLEEHNPMLATRHFAEGPIVLKPFLREALYTHAASSPALGRALADFLMADLSRRTLIASMMEHGVDRASLGFANFLAGEVIIAEGTPADTVYSIVEGHAEVTIDRIKVGEVLENEIFGSLSLLTNSPRTATVTATRNCMCLVVPRHQFETLIRTHPRICMNLMENMARQIVSLNRQITEMRVS